MANKLWIFELEVEIGNIMAFYVLLGFTQSDQVQSKQQPWDIFFLSAF